MLKVPDDGEAVDPAQSSLVLGSELSGSPLKGMQYNLTLRLRNSFTQVYRSPCHDGTWKMRSNAEPVGLRWGVTPLLTMLSVVLTVLTMLTLAFLMYSMQSPNSLRLSRLLHWHF